MSSSAHHADDLTPLRARDRGASPGGHSAFSSPRGRCHMANVSFLHARDLVKNYDGRRVLDNVTLIASPGQRIGLVGDNGVGKSTLLRLLAGHEEPDDGVVTRPDDCGF